MIYLVWSNSLVPSLTIAIMYGLLCLLSLSKESNITAKPVHLSDDPKTVPS